MIAVWLVGEEERKEGKREQGEYLRVALVLPSVQVLRVSPWEPVLRRASRCRLSVVRRAIVRDLRPRVACDWVRIARVVRVEAGEPV